MPSSIPAIFRVGLVLSLIVLGSFFQNRSSEDMDDQSYAVVKEIISREGFDRMAPMHQKMLVHIVKRNEGSKMAPVAACWDTAPTDPETIDAFNAAISLGQSNLPEYQTGIRWSNTAISGGGLGQGDVTTLTYSFVPDGTFVPSGVGEPGANSDLFAWLNGIYGSPAVWQQIFAEEFARWSDVTGITYVFEPNDDGVTLSTGNGVVGVRGDIRISGKFIDGAGGVGSSILAYNSFPNDGDMVLDSADPSYSSAANDSRVLRNVISHEHGHGLGFSHVCPQDGTKLMEPSLITSFLGPQHDEMLGAQRLYGDNFEPNDTVANATNLGVLGNGTTTVANASTDDNSDVDVFRFTINSPKTVNLTLRPIGFTYLEGPQLGSGACSAGTSFNSLTISDLTLEFLDSDGFTVLGVSNGNPAGQNESLSNINLSLAGTYYVRVSPDSTNNVQFYELDVDLASFTPQPIAIEFPDGIPEAIDAQYVNHLRVDTNNSSLTPDPANSYVYVRVDGGPFVQLPMIDQTNGIFWANLPPALNFSKVDFYIEMNAIGGGGNSLSPVNAPTTFHTVDVLQRNTVVVFEDDFETDKGWTVVSEGSVTGGVWERAIPSGDGTRGDPLVDFDGSGRCYVTENGAGNTDVDGGKTRLISPTMDLSGYATARIKYAFWYSNDHPNGTPDGDPFDVHVRESTGSPWVLVERVTASPNSWSEREVVVPSFINLTSTFQIRFRAEDRNSPSVVEAAVDGVVVHGCPLDNPIGPCADGSVGLGLGPAVPTLLVQNSDGGADKEIFVAVNTPYVVAVSNPPLQSNAQYAMFARIGKPSPGEAFPISLEAGDMCFTPALADPLNPLLFTVAWAAPNPPAGVLDPTATPAPWFSVSQGFPFPITVSVQCAIFEGLVLKVSNMVFLTIF